MKALARKLLGVVVRSDLAFRLIDLTIGRTIDFLRARRHSLMAEREGFDRQAWWFDEFTFEQLPRIFPAREVLVGPFAGMRYPELMAFGSTLFPKLLGSYEFELHGVIADCCERDYSLIIDVGCAEGYYAIGLARCLPVCRIIAVDIDPAALEQCQRMAELNGVSDRVNLKASLDSGELRDLASANDRMLVFSDCEGFEDILFDVSTLQALERHDLVIETHDARDPLLSARIRERAEQTHDVTVISSIDDLRRPVSFPCANMRDFTPLEQVRLMAEKRQQSMDWLICRSRRDRPER
jgi:SAM-dependent methyltransferase